jgi:transcriptional regulator with XRE-family HTH domain
MSAGSPLSEAFAAAIKKRRLKEGLSQEALAELAKVHHTYVSMLERGKSKPTIDVAERLARALGRKLSALIAEAERARKD